MRGRPISHVTSLLTIGGMWLVHHTVFRRLRFDNARVISLLFAALSATASRARHLFKPEVTEQEIDALRRASRPNVGFYAGVTALAILAARVAALGYLLIAVAAVLRARGDE